MLNPGFYYLTRDFISWHVCVNKAKAIEKKQTLTKLYNEPVFVYKAMHENKAVEVVL